MMMIFLGYWRKLNLRKIKNIYLINVFKSLFIKEKGISKNLFKIFYFIKYQILNNLNN